MNTQTHTHTEGDRLRDEALARVREHKPLKIWDAQLRFLQALRCAPDRVGTSDLATPIGFQYRGNGAHVGAAIRALREAGLIAEDGFERSQRPSRKSNYVRRWRLVDDAQADAKIAQLERLIDALEPASSLAPAPASPPATSPTSSSQAQEPSLLWGVV